MSWKRLRLQAILIVAKLIPNRHFPQTGDQLLLNEFRIAFTIPPKNRGSLIV